MENFRVKVLLLALAAAATAVTSLPCSADEKKQEQKNIFTEDEPRGRRPWYLRIDLTDQEISRILEDLRKRNPEKAKDLEKLHKKDPDRFKEELRRYGGEAYRKIIREYAERWREQRLAEFLEWLQKNYRREARELAGLKNRDPGLYDKKLIAPFFQPQIVPEDHCKFGIPPLGLADGFILLAHLIEFLVI
jgi:hypothetical protein